MAAGKGSKKAPAKRKKTGRGGDAAPPNKAKERRAAERRWEMYKKGVTTRNPGATRGVTVPGYGSPKQYKSSSSQNKTGPAPTRGNAYPRPRGAARSKKVH